ncbi:MAG: MFS transporter [Methanomicrobiales archaeon]
MWSLSAGMVNIALPSMSQFLDVSVSTISWVITAHLLFLVGFLLIFGKIGDQIGYKKVLTVGLFIFSFSAYYSGLSLEITPLILFRVIQGIGSAMILSVSLAIISLAFSDQNRGKALGFISMATALGLSIGNYIGGLLTEYLSWHWIFFIIFPIGLILLVLSIIFIPSREIARKKVGFDIVGSILMIISLFSLLLAIDLGKYFGWFSTIIILLFISFAVFLLIFCLWELRHPHPLLDLSFLKNYYLTILLLSVFSINFVIYGTIFLIPFFLVLVKGYTAGFAGLVIFLPTSIIIIASPLGGYLSDNIGTNIVKFSSIIFLIISSVILTFLSPTIALITIMIALAFRSISRGLFVPVNNKLILKQSMDKSMGTVSSLLNLFSYLGSIMGVVLYQTIFVSAIASRGISNTGAFQITAPQSLLLNGFYYAFLLGTVVSLLLLLLAFLEFKFENNN